jgi:hypothetical protein
MSSFDSVTFRRDHLSQGTSHLPAYSKMAKVELNGKRPHVEADMVYRFCRALGCTSDYLVGLTDDPTPAKKRPRSRKAAPVS